MVRDGLWTTEQDNEAQMCCLTEQRNAKVTTDNFKIIYENKLIFQISFSRA